MKILNLGLNTLNLGLKEKVHINSLNQGLKFQTGVLADQMHINSLNIVSEYDQEIPQSQTADNPKAPRGRTAQPSRDTRKTN